MSDFENPYQSPESPIVPEKPQGSQYGAPCVGGISLSDTMLRYLKETSPWLRFVGILGFVGCGLITFGGIIFTTIMLTVSSYADEILQVPVWLLSLVYVPMGVLFFFPSRFIYNFGTKLRNYQLSNQDEDLEQAFKNNRSLWKFYGILSIIYLAFIPLSTVMAIVGGIVAAITGLLT